MVKYPYRGDYMRHALFPLRCFASYSGMPTMRYRDTEYVEEMDRSRLTQLTGAYLGRYPMLPYPPTTLISPFRDDYPTKLLTLLP